MPDFQHVETIFAVGICAGVGVGAWFIIWSALQHEGQKWQRWLDVYLLSVLAGIVGARFFYVLLNLSDFEDAPFYVFRLWYGALSWQGAILGVVLVMPSLCKWRKVPLPLFTDGAALASPVILMSISWSCRKVGCLVGHQVHDVRDYPVWLVGYVRDFQGNVLPRYELQMLAIGLFLLILVVMGALTFQNHFPQKRLSISLFLTGLALLLLFRLQNEEVNLDKISALLLIFSSMGLFFRIPSAKRMEINPAN